jgi:hypothetical protein
MMGDSAFVYSGSLAGVVTWGQDVIDGAQAIQVQGDFQTLRSVDPSQHKGCVAFLNC